MEKASEMSSNNSRIAKNAILLYVRMFITIVIGLFTSRIVLQNLGVNDFGIFNLVGGIVVLMNMFSSSISSATSRFLSFCLGKNNADKLSTTFSTAFFIHLFLSLIVLFIGETIGLWFVNTHLVIDPGRMIAANFAYQAALISTVLSITQIPYYACIIAHEKMGVFAFISILYEVLKLIIAICLLFNLHDKLIFYSVLYASVSILIMTIYRLYCIRNFNETHINRVFDKRLAIKMLSFSGWNLFAVVGDTSCKQGVNIILNKFFGTVINAAAGIAIQVQSVLYGFIGNITTAFTPQIIKEYSKGNYVRVNALVFTGTKFTSILTLIITIPVITNLTFLMRLWLGQVPMYTITLCKILLINNVILSLHPLVIYAINASGKIKFRCIWAGSIHLINLVLAYFIVHCFRNVVEEAYWLFPVNSLVILLFVIFNLKHLMPCFLHWRFIFNILLKVSLIGLFSFLVCNYISLQLNSDWIALITTTLFSFVLIGVLSYFFMLNQNEKLFIVEKASKFGCKTIRHFLT